MIDLDSKSETISSLTHRRKEWLEDFKNGALGNQEAYARARDNRGNLEFLARWVPLEVAKEAVKEARVETLKLDNDNIQWWKDKYEDLLKATNANQSMEEKK
jgi:hypothetical protein